MNEEKSLKQWLLDLFQKLFDLFKGKEDNYADDNELLAGMAENDDEKAHFSKHPKQIILQC